MPIKKIPNQISLFEAKAGEVLSYFTFSKRNHFVSEARLFDDLQATVGQVNANFTLHLTTHPFISAHVQCGNPELLMKYKDKLEQVIKQALEMHLKKTH
jgi:hypothetical protein